MSGRLVQAGAALAAAGAAHAALNARLLRRPSPCPPAPHADVSVLVPARDEAGNIAGCLRALLAQQFGDRMEIVVLDDGSSDGTARIARETADGDRRVRVVDGTPPPAGWIGKAHACRQLAAAARPSSRILIFVDADVRLAPNAVAAAVDLLDRHRLDLISPYPRQLAATAAERLVQPLLQWSWLTLLPLRIAESAPRPSMAVANGQFLAVRRDAYERAGGHVPGAVLDDIALARALRRAGGRGGLADGTDLASCRMYDGWAALRDGYTKSLWDAFGGSAGSAGVGALLGVAFVVPAVAALRGSRTGLLGYAAGVAGRVIAARRTGGRAWPDSLAHPLGVALLGVLGARSAIARRRGTLAWRGRAIAPARVAARAASG